jgi:hypothetical protein
MELEVECGAQQPQARGMAHHLRAQEVSSQFLDNSADTVPVL